jgi:hypothetical protein
MIFISFLPFSFLFPQSDSLTIKKETYLKDEIDSLKILVDSLNRKIDLIGKRLDEKIPFDSLLSATSTEKDTSIVPEDQRSRRKQLDELLEYISTRPGQLFFRGQVNSIVQSNFEKGDKFSTGEGSVNLFASSSFGNSTILFIDLEAVGGNGPDEFATTLSTLNGDAGSTQANDGFDRITVSEAWTEFLFLNNIFTVTIGKIDLTNYFDNNAVANDENSQFISGIFINNPAFAVPSSSPGIRIRTSLLDRFYIQFAFSKVENSGSNIFQQIYKAASLGFKFLPNTDFEANVRMFGYSHPFADNRYGFGISIDQTIAILFTIFGRFGNNENTLAQWYGIKTSWSAGVQFKENLLGEITTIGIATGQIKPSVKELETEKSFELYLRQYLNNWISISAHFQHIFDSGGVNGKYSLAGLRLNITF